MRVKFNRGPMARKVQDVKDDYTREYRVREVLPFDWRAAREQPLGDMPHAAREGSYYRSNVVLKNGTVVFEWMGWKSSG